MIPYKMFMKGLEKVTVGSLCAQMPEMEVWCGGGGQRSRDWAGLAQAPGPSSEPWES